MFTIAKENCILSADNRGLITEASTAGLRPGEWPEFIAVTDQANCGFLFQRSYKDFTDDGEFCGMHYRERSSNFRLLVIND